MQCFLSSSNLLLLAKLRQAWRLSLKNQCLIPDNHFTVQKAASSCFGIPASCRTQRVKPLLRRFYALRCASTTTGKPGFRCHGSKPRAPTWGQLRVGGHVVTTSDKKRASIAETRN